MNFSPLVRRFMNTALGWQRGAARLCPLCRAAMPFPPMLPAGKGELQLQTLGVGNPNVTLYFQYFEAFRER